jgi:hypothetical protein
MKINIADLDLSLQTRAGTDAETIDNYAEAMAGGEKFPAVMVFTDGTHFWLADGFHRVMAAKQLGKKQISADIREGTEDDAVVFGGTANNKQGKRPTRADTRHFMEMVWERREAIFGGTPTGGNFAAKCGVSATTGKNFVNEQLAKMASKPPAMPTRPNSRMAAKESIKMPVRPAQLVGANGRLYPAMPTRPAKPAHIVPTDIYGVEIPVPIQSAFEVQHLQEILSSISEARVLLRRGIDAGMPVFAAVRQDALVQLNNAYSFVASAKAHCVCRMCQGQGCKACHGRGWQTAEEYERNPKEFKAEG